MMIMEHTWGSGLGNHGDSTSSGMLTHGSRGILVNKSRKVGVDIGSGHEEQLDSIKSS